MAKSKSTATPKNAETPESAQSMNNNELIAPVFKAEAMLRGAMSLLDDACMDGDIWAAYELIEAASQTIVELRIGRLEDLQNKIKASQAQVPA